jgi:PIN domain nuclease of toxin-antitoxin system
MLPQHHRDPFDRIIIATALIGGETMLSADKVFDMYGVVRVWE